MSVESDTRTEIVSTLKARVLAISDCIIALYKEGYIPNKRKRDNLIANNIFLDIATNINSMTEEEFIKFKELIYKINNL